MKLRDLTVSEATNYISRLFSGDPILNACSVIGELSGLKRYPSGHVYFSIVDENSKLPCVMFRSDAERFDGLRLRGGDRVKLKGRVAVYQREGRYQMICHSIALDGDGDLLQKFLLLKAELSEKGYFDQARKRDLPKIRRVGVITSKVGAAIEDFTSILRRRNRLIEIELYPSLVQGRGAAAQIVAGIDYFNRLKAVDAIVITRGGGSIEDLSCFNDASLAEAIYDSNLPIISAVGHETDFTIADFVADLRAATPSAAAELISFPLAEVAREMERLLNDMNGVLNARLSALQAKLKDNHPLNLLSGVRRIVEYDKLQVSSTFDRASAAIESILKDRRQRAEQLHKTIFLQNPERLLARGYCYAKDGNGELINSVEAVKRGDDISLIMSDGALIGTVKEVIK